MRGRAAAVGLVLVVVSPLAAQADGSAPKLGPGYAAGYAPRALVARDFDEDGKVDLVVAGDHEIALLRGAGKGRLRSRETLLDCRPLGTCYGAEAADLDGDGLTDLISATGDPTELSILGGRGKGLFEKPRTVQTDSARFTTGDFDGDGDVDLATAEPARFDNLDQRAAVSVFRNAGDGSFGEAEVTRVPRSEGAEAIASADLDKDGRSEILFGDELQVFELGMTADGLAVRAVTPGCGQADAIAAGDLNGDGVSDIAADCHSSNRVRVFIRRAAGFEPAGVMRTGVSPVSITMADIDKDGHFDVAAGAIGQQDEFDGDFGDEFFSGGDIVTLGYGRGDGTFRKTREVRVSAPAALAAAELDGDGRPDLAVADIQHDLVRLLLTAGPSSGLPHVSMPRRPPHFDPRSQSVLVPLRCGRGKGACEGLLTASSTRWILSRRAFRVAANRTRRLTVFLGRSVLGSLRVLVEARTQPNIARRSYVIADPGRRTRRGACSPRAARIIASSRFGTLLYFPSPLGIRALYCRFSVGALQDLPGELDAGPFAMRGRYVAYARDVCDDANQPCIREAALFDITRPDTDFGDGREREIRCESIPPGKECNVGSVAVSATGAVAWTTCRGPLNAPQHCARKGRGVVEIYASDARRTRLVDSSTAIAPRSLRFARGALTWTKRGAAERRRVGRGPAFLKG